MTNRATADARAAIGLFVDRNAARLQGWLDAIAEEDPEKAFTLFQSVVEYHVPKLARTEVNAHLTAKSEAIVKVTFVPVKDAT